MKIRIKGNAVRYRLTRTDITQFINNGYIEERTEFGDQVLIYALAQYSQEHLSAFYENNTITVLMPKLMATKWEAADCTGFESKGQLHILVEKDFQCLDTVEEDQSDNYPNPLAAQINL